MQSLRVGQSNLELILVEAANVIVILRNCMRLTSFARLAISASVRYSLIYALLLPVWRIFALRDDA